MGKQPFVVCRPSLSYGHALVVICFLLPWMLLVVKELVVDLLREMGAKRT